MSKAVEYNATGIQSCVRLFTAATSLPATGVTVDVVTDLEAYYRREFEAAVEIPLTDVAIDDDWTEGGFRELGIGYYGIDVPDAAFAITDDDIAAGIRSVITYLVDDGNDYICIPSQHPLQRVLEAVSFTTDGGLYAVAADLYEVFGQLNIYKWANIESLDDNDEDYETNIQGRITKAITLATADINDKLRGGPYEIPFTNTSLTATVNYICILKAGIWLYEWRGADDYNFEDGRVTHRYSFLSDRADKMLEQLRRDARRLGSQTSSDTRIRVPGIGDMS